MVWRGAHEEWEQRLMIEVEERSLARRRRRSAGLLELIGERRASFEVSGAAAAA